MQVNESALAHMKNKMSHRLNKLNKRRQRGVTLVELSVAVAVMGLIMAGALVGVPRLMDGVRTTQEIKALQQAVVNTQNAITLGTLTERLDAAKLKQTTLLESFTPSGNSNNYVNGFGGVIEPVAPTDQGIVAGFALKYTMVPVASCEKLIGSLHSNFTEITVNEKKLKDRNTPFNPSELSTACSSKEDPANKGQQLPQSRAELIVTIAS